MESPSDTENCHRCNKSTETCKHVFTEDFSIATLLVVAYLIESLVQVSLLALFLSSWKILNSQKSQFERNICLRKFIDHSDCKLLPVPKHPGDNKLVVDPIHWMDCHIPACHTYQFDMDLSRNGLLRESLWSTSLLPYALFSFR